MFATVESGFRTRVRKYAIIITAKMCETTRKYLFYVSISDIARSTLHRVWDAGRKWKCAMMERSMGKWLVYGCLLRINKITTKFICEGDENDNDNMCAHCARSDECDTFTTIVRMIISLVMIIIHYSIKIMVRMSVRTKFSACRPSFIATTQTSCNQRANKPIIFTFDEWIKYFRATNVFVFDSLISFQYRTESKRWNWISEMCGNCEHELLCYSSWQEIVSMHDLDRMLGSNAPNRLNKSAWKNSIWHFIDANQSQWTKRI